MDPELLDLLRDDLAAADFSAAAVSALLGAEADAARQRGVPVPARRVLAAREVSPLATLVRLFLLGEAIDAASLDAALPRLRSAGAEALALVVDAADGGGLRAALSLNPVELPGREEDRGWWILSDLDDHLRAGAARPDHVMGVGRATRSLIAQAPMPAPATARAPRSAEALETVRALDLGTGCGVVALWLARSGAARVVATDVSERALRFARANARLNGVDDGPGGAVEFRSGDLFEPVAGERFDLLLSNPPFVITPRDSAVPVYEYRDAGRSGDDLIRQVVREGPGHLSPGGTLLCLGNWEQPWGGNGLARVSDWVEEASRSAGTLAAWVIERDRVDPVRYAETWVRDGGSRPGEPAFDALISAWMRDFAERRVVAVGLGSIRIRRFAPDPSREHPDRNVIRLDDAPGAFGGETPGALLQQCFAEGIAAELESAAEILASRWRLSARVSEVREHAPGEEAPRSIALRIDQPIERIIASDTLLAAAVGACDGDLTLEQIADALATLLEVHADAARDALAAGARELAWLGVLSRSRR